VTTDIPGPSSTAEAVTWIRGLRSSPLETLMALRDRYGDLAAIRFPQRGRFVLASHPDHVQHVLQSAHRRYRKSAAFQVLEDVLGMGLLTSDGEVWRTHRRLAQPAFHHDHVAGWATMMAAHTATHVARWADGQRIDVAHEMREVTLRIVGDALFSVDMTADRDAVGSALDDTLAHSRRRLRSRLGPLVDPPTWSRHRSRRAAARLDDVVHGIIDGRDRAEPGDDLLGMLMAAEDADTGAVLDRGELRDEVMTFLLAGHETTAHALAWSLWLLAESGDAWREVRAELDEVLGGRLPGIEDLDRLVWTRAVVDEGMRLYPPAWITARTPRDTDELAGHELTTTDMVNVSQWVTHRHPDVWERPTAFDPRRWIDGPEVHRYAYFPFGGGPRMCIGSEFAKVEAVMVMATLLQAVDIVPVPGFPVVPLTGITLRPARGVLATVHRR